MSRVKRGVTTTPSTKKNPKAAKGFFCGPPQEHDPRRQGRGRQIDAIRLPRPQEPQRQIPRPWIQRINAAVCEHGFDLQPVHFRLAGRGSKSIARSSPSSPFPSRRPSPRSSKRRRGICPRRRSASTAVQLIRHRHALRLGRRSCIDRRGPDMSDFAVLQHDTVAAIEGGGDESALENVRVAALGKKGSISALLGRSASCRPTNARFMARR